MRSRDAWWTWPRRNAWMVMRKKLRRFYYESFPLVPILGWVLAFPVGAVALCAGVEEEIFAAAIGGALAIPLGVVLLCWRPSGWPLMENFQK